MIEISKILAKFRKTRGNKMLRIIESSPCFIYYSPLQRSLAAVHRAKKHRFRVNEFTNRLLFTLNEHEWIYFYSRSILLFVLYLRINFINFAFYFSPLLLSYICHVYPPFSKNNKSNNVQLVKYELSSNSFNSSNFHKTRNRNVYGLYPTLIHLITRVKITIKYNRA